MKKINILLLTLFMASIDCFSQIGDSSPIKAFNIDFNWCELENKSSLLNSFAIPGQRADVDPQEQIKWFKDLNCNVIQAFAVSCNGYSWYKNSIVPTQPGLKHDYLTELVDLGHKNNISVFGYFCIGSNTKWGLGHPDQSYGTPNQPHIPFTKDYLNYLSTVIKDAIVKTNMDGFMIDWLWNPTAAVCGPAREQRWLDCEKQMYKELMNEEFPGKEKITKEIQLEYNRRAIDRCWKTIYNTTKKTNPNCIIWLSCSQLENPEIINSDLLKQVDWLQNEAGDKESISFAKSQIGKHTRLITTLSNGFLKRNHLKAEDVIKYAKEDNIGIYCYASPKSDEWIFPPVKDYLSKPLSSFVKQNDINIALLARFYNGLPIDK